MSTFSNINISIGKVINTVSTIADLRNYKPRSIHDGDTVIVSAGAILGDRNGGTFVWVEGSTVADDGADTIRPVFAIGQGRWVKMFGKGDRGATGADSTVPGPRGPIGQTGPQGDGLATVMAPGGSALIDASVTAAVATSLQERLDDYISVLTYIPRSRRAAIREGTSEWDATAAIQSALDDNLKLFFPKGVYRINAKIGLNVKSGQHIVGEGMNSTALYALPGGGTIAELFSYGAGSMVRRKFDVNAQAFGDNPYVNNFRIADIACILNHPIDRVTATDHQIGIDLRNITRSRVERCHVGNIPPLALSYLKPNSGGNFSVQGYGVVTGTMSGSSPAYAGGEVNTITGCEIWGAYKGISQDDGDLTLGSGAHATTVMGCDIQGCHMLLVQESPYTAGGLWDANCLQNVQPQPNNANARFVMRLMGYNMEVRPGYIEVGNQGDYFIYMDAASKANSVAFLHATATNTHCSYSDNGKNNQLVYRADTGSIPGGIDSSGPQTVSRNGLIDKAPRPDYAEQLLKGDGETLFCEPRTIDVGGGGAERTAIKIANGSFSGQLLTIVANSWPFSFSAGAAEFATATPPIMGAASGQVSTISFVWTVSGWFETSRAVRP